MAEAKEENRACDVVSFGRRILKPMGVEPRTRRH